MEPNYLIILNFVCAKVIIIKLTEEEKAKSEEYEDFEAFMREELEDKYDFKTCDVNWMVTDDYSSQKYNF